MVTSSSRSFREDLWVCRPSAPASAIFMKSCSVRGWGTTSVKPPGMPTVMYTSEGTTLRTPRVTSAI